MKQFADTVPSHPGQFISEFVLPASRMTAAELARSLRLSTVAIHYVLRGRRSITPATAVRLAALFDVPAKAWLDLQQRYDIALAASELADELAQIIPYDGPPLGWVEMLERQVA